VLMLTGMVMKMEVWVLASNPLVSQRILLEDGTSILLLENGDSFILES
jgi:hypothetical protein